ncbi:MAG: response regulator transcription factor [Lachnospiraceae bacterium]|nr:response regulator transcription factor [Lachnospiraceae bacterium]
MYNVLICDDEKDIVNALEIYLSAEDIRIFKAYNGKEAIEAVKNNEIHLALLDIMMPIMDGIQAINEIRKFSNLPVIFLSAKGEDTDKILGLNVGADDYVTKPFNPVEVIARVKSNLRRYTMLGSAVKTESALKVNGIEIDDDLKQVFVDGEEIKLTPIEYDILKLLAGSPGKVFSSKEIYQKVWKNSVFDIDGTDGTVAVHIRHIREKIEINPAEPRHLKVIWGQGYKCE